MRSHLRPYCFASLPFGKFALVIIIHLFFNMSYALAKHYFDMLVD